MVRPRKCSLLRKRSRRKNTSRAGSVDMERHFERELDDLKSNLVKMGSLVDDQLGKACEALFGANVPLAKQVIERDSEVDSFDTLIDKQCLRIFALSQPVAMDLRLLMSALKI